MRFTVIPEHFSPTSGPVVYEIEAAAGEAAPDVEVSDTATGELLGVKRFAGAGTIRANVAGYIRRMLGPQPQVPAAGGGFRFSRDTGRQAAVTVRAGSAVAPSRVFTCALGRAEEFGILSKMPSERMLAEGEWDEISVAVPDTVLSAEMRVAGDGEGFTLRTGEFMAVRGVATLTVDAKAIAGAAEEAHCRFADFRRAEVKIYAHDELIAEAAYRLYGRSRGQMRLCWQNGMGGIDYHTFHVVSEENAAASRQRILSDGGYRTVVSAAERTFGITSGYCAPPLSDALAETVTSPRVWRAERSASGECSAALLDVVTDRAASRTGELFCLQLTVREHVIING